MPFSVNQLGCSRSVSSSVTVEETGVGEVVCANALEINVDAKIAITIAERMLLSPWPVRMLLWFG